MHRRHFTAQVTHRVRESVTRWHIQGNNGCLHPETNRHVGTLVGVRAVYWESLASGCGDEGAGEEKSK